MNQNINEDAALNALTEAVVEALDDKKAADVVVMDVRGRCSFTDRLVLANGRTNRQLKALAQAVSTVAHTRGMPANIEGGEAMEWLLVDLDDVVVHLFLPDVRENVQLERLWTSPSAHQEATSDA